MANRRLSAAYLTGAAATFGCLSSSNGSFVPSVQRLLASDLSMSSLFKFPQMDFEMAIWEMTHLLIAPKKVFKSIFYQKRLFPLPTPPPPPPPLSLTPNHTPDHKN